MPRRPKVLFIVHRVPYPPNRGDRIRSYHLLKFLAERADVSLASLTDEPLAAGTLDELNRHCRRVAVEHVPRARWARAAGKLLAGGSATEGLFASSKLRRTLEGWSRETRFDAVVVFCSSMVQYLSVPGLQGVPAVVDLVDVDSQKFLDYASEAGGCKRLLYRLEGQRLRAIEKGLVGRAQAITLVSEAEATLFRTFCPNDRTFALENGVDLQYFQPTQADVKPQQCVFVGAMDYYPNASGIGWFCAEVWPKVLGSFPQATLSIVGRNPPVAVQRLALLPGVTVVGTVPDVRPYVAEAAAVVVPLRIARGIQNKVLEAMAMGKPVLASPQALDGLQLERGRDALCASTPDEWLAALQPLFSDSSVSRQLSIAARQFVETHHAWSATLEPLARLVGVPSGVDARESALV
jgi:sugar transferase (PEP-CTERM/EpsH1 system associated)